MKRSLKFVSRLSVGKTRPSVYGYDDNMFVKPEVKSDAAIIFPRRTISDFVDENSIEYIVTLDDLDLQSVGM